MQRYSSRPYHPDCRLLLAIHVLLYFAYGSNLNPRSVAEWARHHGRRAPILRNGRPAVLENHRLAFPVFSEYWGGGTADIVYDPGKNVGGAVFDVTPADVEALNAKVRLQQDSAGRDVGSYKQVGVEVRPLGLGKPMKAFTFQGVVPEAYHIPPTQNYLDLLVEGAFEHGLSQMWVAYLKSFSTQAARTPRPPRVAS